jgi:rhamnosyltransferase
MTQDAILADVNSLCHILEPFNDDLVAAVCGRQLPKKHAAPIESHARLYNYPSQSCLRSIHDAEKIGLKTAFISNSFAAYRVQSLLEVGGFPENVIFGEDMFVAAKLLQAGYKIAYAADACVYHSHTYTVWQEFRRYFDMGVFHSREPWIRDALGNAEGAGLKFVVSEIDYLIRHSFWRIPEALLRTVLRYLGFRIGLEEQRLPSGIKRRFAMNKIYFT